MIELKINKMAFGTNVIFEDTYINIDQSKFIGIKGESGAGKSTLLSMIGLLKKFKGEYFANGMLIPFVSKEKYRKNLFGYVFQQSLLIPFLSVKENVVEPLKNLKNKVDWNKYNDVMELLKIKNLENRLPETLSGGEQQRVAIARAVMVNRKYILVDEPTGNLDPNNAHIVMECFKKIIETYNTTIIMVTHSQDFDDYFDEIYFIEGKKIKLYAKR